jgi:hypothetical protein
MTSPVKMIMTLFLFCINIFMLSAQDSAIYFKGTYKETAIFSGVSINFGDTANKKSYIIELGIWKSKYITHIEPFNANYYLSNEFVLHDSKLIIGPKIGGFIGFWMFCLGSEIIFYTNFRENALRLVPYIGLGGHNFKFTINPLINLYNKDFKYINPVSLSLTIQIKSIRKRQI